MQKASPGSIVSDPVIDRSEKSGSIVWLILLATALVVSAVLLAVLPRQEAAFYVQVLLGVLAVIGVCALFAGAIGLIRFGQRPQRGASLSRLVLEALPDGLIVTDADGRIIFATRLIRF